MDGAELTKLEMQFNYMASPHSCCFCRAARRPLVLKPQPPRQTHR